MLTELAQMQERTQACTDGQQTTQKHNASDKPISGGDNRGIITVQWREWMILIPREMRGHGIKL